MISSGRRGLHESLVCLCRIQAPQAFASQRTTSLISTPAACLHTHRLPCQPTSLMAARHFAAASVEQYSPEGQMSAVTFHGPRSMKVSKKAKPRLETPGVRICTLLASPVVLQMISADRLTTCILQCIAMLHQAVSSAGCDCESDNVQHMWQRYAPLCWQRGGP